MRRDEGGRRREEGGVEIPDNLPKILMIIYRLPPLPPTSLSVECVRTPL